MQEVDVFISGGGIAGLSLAAALGSLGHSIYLADPGRAQTDLRSTAYLLPAKRLFETIGVWDVLAPTTTHLSALRVVDTSGWPPEVKETRTFLPTDLGADHFGWNIPNETARTALIAYLEKQPNVTLAMGVGFQSMLTRQKDARVKLTDGSQIKCRLVVGSDGRNSPVRDTAGIRFSTKRYGQKALAFTASHVHPHQNISTEIYNQGGAFTTVPLPDHNGAPCSAIVWMNTGPRAQELATLPEDDFNTEMTTRSCGLLGPMARTAAPNVWPVITQTANQLTAERTAILAEAAHVLPPIGAQGLNTSLLDVAALYAEIAKHPEGLGAPEQLARFEKTRKLDTKLRARAIDLFNRVCMSGDPMIQSLRSAGLKAVHDAKPLRDAIMRAGIGG